MIPDNLKLYRLVRLTIIKLTGVYTITNVAIRLSGKTKNKKEIWLALGSERIFEFDFKVE